MSVEVNSHGTNKAIQFHILSDDEMRKVGFNDSINNRWYFSRDVWEEHRSTISFNVYIPKDGSEPWIWVLDEDFAQPYDYQYLLECESPPKVAYEVKDNVEKWMAYLTEHGVISGHEYGNYI